jgi:hypothetical protein
MILSASRTVMSLVVIRKLCKDGTEVPLTSKRLVGGAEAIVSSIFVSEQESAGQKPGLLLLSKSGSAQKLR